MKQVQFFKYTTIVLVVLNVALIAFLLLGKPPHKTPRGHEGPPGPPPTSMEQGGFLIQAQEMLQLSEEQGVAFVASAERHNATMDSISTAQRSIMRVYFSGVGHADNPADTAALQQLEQLEGRKIAATRDHFEEVRSMMNEDQLATFGEFMQEAVRKLLSDPRQSPPAPGDRRPPR